VERLRSATPGGVTCSAGVALWDGLESADQLLGRADRALYAAKQQGRDRIAVTGEPDSA
jgi:GGDEF domain-containing protein